MEHEPSLSRQASAGRTSAVESFLRRKARTRQRAQRHAFASPPGVMLKLDFVHRLVAFDAERWVPGCNEGAESQAMIAAPRPI
jgi:hypothetical protein